MSESVPAGAPRSPDPSESGADMVTSRALLAGQTAGPEVVEVAAAQPGAGPAVSVSAFDTVDALLTDAIRTVDAAPLGGDAQTGQGVQAVQPGAAQAEQADRVAAAARHDADAATQAQPAPPSGAAQTQAMGVSSNVPPGSFILHVSLDPSATNYYGRIADTVGQPPTVIEFPDGTRAWRDEVGGPIRHESNLILSLGRAHSERKHYTAPEHGNLPAGPNYQRAHSLGQSTGFESPYAIYYAPEYVNQTLQNHGIETYMRNLVAHQQAGESLRVITETQAHPLSRRLSNISYRIEVVIGGKPYGIAEYTISVSNSRRHPVVTADALRLASNAIATAIAERAPIPPVLLASTSHVC
jgi:hypothetical protein